VEIFRDGKSPGKASDAAPLQKSIDASKTQRTDSQNRTEKRRQKVTGRVYQRDIARANFENYAGFWGGFARQNIYRLFSNNSVPNLMQSHYRWRNYFG
jgi:hypothetical protein